jgi:cbb3-type cytochrome c oxidase subunit III
MPEFGVARMSPGRYRMKPLIWLVSLLSAMMLVTNTYAQDEPNPLKGVHLYRSYCLVCHGADGKSTGPVARKLNLKPADLSSEQYQTKKVEDLVVLIAGYRKTEETKMPNWGMVLSDEDLLDIAAYVSHMTEKDLRFTGDTRRGRIIFKTACVSCHGKAGRGKGVLAYLFRIPMTDFTESEKMKNIDDGELINIIREGKGPYMAPWKETLTDEEITDVASYVRMLAR